MSNKQVRQPAPQPQPANTMIGVQVKSAFYGVSADEGARIVHLQFQRMTYSDCHMMLSPWRAALLGLDLLWTALVAQVWIRFRA